MKKIIKQSLLITNLLIVSILSFVNPYQSKTNSNMLVYNCECDYNYYNNTENLDEINDCHTEEDLIEESEELAEEFSVDENEVEENEIDEFIIPTDPEPTIPNIDIPIYYQTSFTSNYFRNLNSNYITNSIGNCGYTAFSQYLSFLDTYWNNGIIPDVYNQKTTIPTSDDTNGGFNSPGIKDNTIYDPENYLGFSENTKFIQFIFESVNNMDTSFFGLLINYAISYVLPNEPASYILSHYMTWSEPSLGITSDMLDYIINQYILNNDVLNNHCTLYTYSVNDTFTYEELLINLKALLSQGIPVMIGTYNGHECVAYEYDEINDEIYVNLGYGPQWSHKKLTDYLNEHPILDENDEFVEDNYIADYRYIVLDDTISHMHQQSYKIGNNIVYKCSCALSSHTHQYSYVFYSSQIHYKRCIDSLVASPENHFVSSTYIENGHEYGVCKCGYTIDITYDPNPTF